MHVFVIKFIRKKKRISLDRLSYMTNISKTYLSELENNLKNNPSLDLLTIIASKLHVNVKDLFYTTADLEALGAELDKKIQDCGLNSREVVETSKLIDLLVTLKLRGDC